MNTDYPTKPRVQSTVQPDEKLTFNEVFEHIYRQLKVINRK